MKLNNYLNEAVTLDNIKKDCSDYLKIWKILDNRNLYRGSWDYKNQLSISKPQKNREPKDTPIEIHNELDNRI